MWKWGKATGVWRTACIVLLGVASSSCNDRGSTTVNPDAGSAAQVASGQASAGIATSTAPSASAASAPVAESASPGASSAPAAGASAGPTAASQTAPPAASASARAPSRASAGVKDGLPKAPRGILPPGAADKILARGEKPVVRLLDPGAPPLAPLVYALETARDRTFGMRVGMRIGIDVGGQALPVMHIPKMAMLFNMNVGDPNAGAHPVDVVLQRISLEPEGMAEEQVAGALRPGLDAMKNLRMRYEVTPKGQMRNAELDFPPSIPAGGQDMLRGMNQSLESMIVGLPDEPIGVGARWRVTGRLSSAGAELLQIATYTLKARSDPRATIDVAITQLATSAVVNNPQIPAGVTARLRAFQSEGGGTSEIDLTEPAPRSGTMTIKSRMEVESKDSTAGPGAAPERSKIESTVTAEFFRPAASSAGP